MKNSLLILSVVLLVSSGCRWGVCTKREQEGCCPTDIRQKHCWCWGEDAIFDTPCGPDEVYHGHKPTCWREWQAPAAVWRDEHCGPPAAGPCNVVNMSTSPLPGAEVIAQPPAAAPELAPPEKAQPEGVHEEAQGGSQATPQGDEQPEFEEELGPLPELEDLDPLPEMTPQETSLSQPNFALQENRQTVYRVTSELGRRASNVTFAAGSAEKQAEEHRHKHTREGYVDCEARRLPPLMGFEVVR